MRNLRSTTILLQRDKPLALKKAMMQELQAERTTKI